MATALTGNWVRIVKEALLTCMNVLSFRVHHFPSWQKESWQTFEETSGYVRPERVNKWANSMTDI
jgi:hypothetical protein